MGADLFNIISHPDDLPKLYDALQKIRNLKHDEVVELDYRVRDAQGEWHWLLSRYLVFSRSEEGRVWQTLGTAQDISDRKRAEMETAKMQNFLNSIIENIPNMVFVKDAETLRFLRLNTAGEKLLGYSREELLGKNDFDFFPPEEATFFNAKDKEVLAQTSIVDIPQETIQTKHQGIRILHTKKIPILDESGQPQYLLGISEDITEQMESEYRLRQIARHLPGVIYQFRMRVDGSFHFPYASEGIQLIYGVTPQEVQEDATPVLSVLHPDDLERVYQSILDSAANLAPWHCEYRVRFDDGRVIWVIGYATPQRILDGSTVWYGYIKDIILNTVTSCEF
jgi:PAS domain S-box-containing protein